MEKRRHQRVDMKNLFVDIFDGWGFFSATVADLSRVGLKLVDVPKNWTTLPDNYQSLCQRVKKISK